jgi:aldehyde:ferredoxin oxidoreductase
MFHFSVLLENSDMHTVMRANRICNEMGMDTISAAATLACFSEISQKRLLPNEIVSLLVDIGKKGGWVQSSPVALHHMQRVRADPILR